MRALLGRRRIRRRDCRRRLQLPCWGRGCTAIPRSRSFASTRWIIWRGWSRCCGRSLRSVLCAGGDTRHRRGYDCQHAVSGRSHLHAAVATAVMRRILTRCSFCGRTTRRSGSRGGDHCPLRPRRKQLRPPFGQPLFVGVFLVEGPAPAAGFRTAAPRCVGRRRAVRLDSGRTDRLPRYGGLRSGFAAAAGRKVMWAKSGGGYPPEVASPDSAVLPILRRLPVRTYGYDTPAGTLSPEWAAKLGLSGRWSPGGECRLPFGRRQRRRNRRTVVLNLGTSACYMAVMPPKRWATGWSKAFSVRWTARYFRHGRIRSGHVGLRRRVRVVQACSAGRCARDAPRPITRNETLRALAAQTKERLLSKLARSRRAAAPTGPMPAGDRLSERPPFALSLQPADRFGRGAEPLGDRTGALLRLCRGDGFSTKAHTRFIWRRTAWRSDGWWASAAFAEIPLCHAAARPCDGHGDEVSAAHSLRARRRGPCGRRRGTLSVGRCGAAGALSVRRRVLRPTPRSPAYWRSAMSVTAPWALSPRTFYKPIRQKKPE